MTGDEKECSFAHLFVLSDVLLHDAQRLKELTVLIEPVAREFLVGYSLLGVHERDETETVCGELGHVDYVVRLLVGL